MILNDNPPAGIQPKRAAKRCSLRAHIHVRKFGYSKSKVAMLDLSTGGCKVDMIGRVAIEETVWITFSGLQAIEARVAWANLGRAGIKFVNPIHPAVFDMLVARMGC